MHLSGPIARPRAPRCARLTALSAIAALAGACASAPAPPIPTAPAGPAEPAGRGLASWYGSYHHGKTTACGEPFDMRDYTAAHKTLAFGSVVRVTRTDTLQYVVVRINDRGPYADDRVIDLSRAAARDLGAIEAGVVPVSLELLAPGSGACRAQ